VHFTLDTNTSCGDHFHAVCKAEKLYLFILLSGRSDKFEHVCVPSPDWLAGAFGARESQDGRPAVPVEAVGTMAWRGRTHHLQN